ncbi:MAG: acyl carrier protein [Actinomycetota bacterium]|nr:acyl carrier protein [Actinomycetota bacterium]
MSAEQNVDIDTFVDRVRSLSSFDIPDDATPYDNLQDELGVDSLQVYELIVIVEGLACTFLPPAETPQLRTLADAYDYYWACVRLTESEA